MFVLFDYLKAYLTSVESLAAMNDYYAPANNTELNA